MVPATQDPSLIWTPMKNYLAIALFTIVVSATYTAIAQFLPQLENHPPAVVELGSNIGPEDLAVAGEGVFESSCAQCHKMGESGHCPDLATSGTLAVSRAKERAEATGEDFTDVDYLVEALCQPGDYLVEGYGNIMPKQGKVLSGGQVLAVVAFLQDQGGEASVKGTDVGPVERFGCVTGGGGGEAEAAGAEPVGPPEAVFNTFGCVGCHMLAAPVRTLGPPMFGVGARLSKSEIYEALLDPDATMAEGDPPYPGGLMKATLEGNGLYERMTAADYRALVEWLASHTGT